MPKSRVEKNPFQQFGESPGLGGHMVVCGPCEDYVHVVSGRGARVATLPNESLEDWMWRRLHSLLEGVGRMIRNWDEWHPASEVYLSSRGEGRRWL